MFSDGAEQLPLSQGQAQFPFYFWKGLATSGLAEQAAEEPLAAESTEEWTRGPSQRQPFLRMRNEGAIRAEPNSAPAAKGCKLAFPAAGRVVTPGRGNYPSASQDTWVTGPSIKRKNNLPGQKQNKKQNKTTTSAAPWRTSAFMLLCHFWLSVKSHARPSGTSMHSVTG